MNFPAIIQSDCLPTAPVGVDERCSDPAFAAAHPDICGDGGGGPGGSTPVLIIKPGSLLLCTLGSIQFRLFEELAGVETEVTSGAVWTSSAHDIAVVGVNSGNATGVAPGSATITASYQGLTATARLTVLAGTNCCEDVSVATVLLLDTSKSMSLAFGTGYATREDFAKSMAAQYAAALNVTKDVIGLISFDALPGTVENLTSDPSVFPAAIGSLGATQNSTGIGLALQAAIAMLAISTAFIKSIVLISDGEDHDTVSADNATTIASGFKNTGGLITCVGVRASGAGFNLLNNLSTGGFFVNAYPAMAAAARLTVMGLRGYICGGRNPGDGVCAPAGNVTAGNPAQNFDAFTNWDVTGFVDLIGSGAGGALYDLLPGNGLYVDMAGSQIPFAGQITSKVAFDFVAGVTYQLAFNLAGNNREDDGIQGVQVQIGDGSILLQTVMTPDYKQGFQHYSLNFTVPAAVSGKISFAQIFDPDHSGVPYGNLLDNVTLTDVTDGALIFSDNFDSENSTFIPPACGGAWDGYAYSYGYDCYGYDCLTESPGIQLPDPSPLPDIEAGYVPPTTYTSTKPYTAVCPAHTLQAAVTTSIPVLASDADPAFILTPSSEESGFEAYLAFGTGSWRGTQIGGGFVTLTGQLPAAALFVSFALTADSVINNVPVDIQLSGSNDGSMFTVLAGFNAQAFTTGQRREFLVTHPNSYLYYQLAIRPTGAVGGDIGLKLIEYFVADDAGVGITKTATATSTISQALADKAALDAAKLLAQAALTCVYQYTSTQSYKATCEVDFGNGTLGSDRTMFATRTSLVSQADADKLAGDAAKAAAIALLDCTGSNNDAGVTIVDNGPAHPYPSVEHVKDLTGLITKVTCRLIGFGHGNAADVHMILVSPNGTKITLMRNCGNGAPTPSCDLVFDDAGAALPASGAIASGTYKPTQFGIEVTFPDPAPQAPYGTAMSAFNGEDPNGSWALWIWDTEVLDTGFINNGWTLDITTA